MTRRPLHWGYINRLQGRGGCGLSCCPTRLRTGWAWCRRPGTYRQVCIESCRQLSQHSATSQRFVFPLNASLKRKQMGRARVGRPGRHGPQLVSCSTTPTHPKRRPEVPIRELAQSLTPAIAVLPGDDARLVTWLLASPKHGRLATYANWRHGRSKRSSILVTAQSRRSAP